MAAPAVRENVAFALRRSRLAKADARARTDAMLDRVGLGKLTDRYPNELSGDEQQRVALARALVGGTGLILCDEPLSSLDADVRERMRVEISSLVRESGATAICITHEQAEAFALADQIGLLQAGQLIQFGRPEEIYTEPASPFVARFTGLSGELPSGSGTARSTAMARCWWSPGHCYVRAALACRESSRPAAMRFFSSGRPGCRSAAPKAPAST